MVGYRTAELVALPTGKTPVDDLGGNGLLLCLSVLGCQTPHVLCRHYLLTGSRRMGQPTPIRLSIVRNGTLYRALFSGEATGARRSIVLTTFAADGPPVLDGHTCAGSSGCVSPGECVRIDRHGEAGAPAILVAGIVHRADPSSISSRRDPRARVLRMVGTMPRFDPGLRRLDRHTWRIPPLEFSRLPPRTRIVGGVERTGGHGGDPVPLPMPISGLRRGASGLRTIMEGAMRRYERQGTRPR